MANYKVIIEAIIQQANVQAQLNQIKVKPVILQANFDQQKIDNQIKRWQDALDKMQARQPAVFKTPQVQEAVKAQQDLMMSHDGTAKSMDKVKTAISNTSKVYAQQSVAINGVSTSAQGLGNILSKLGTNMQTVLAKIAMWGINTAIIYGAVRQVREMVQYLKDLDKEMTNIRVVTGMTQEQVSSLATTFNNLATELGATTLEIAKGSTEWFRQGKSVQETAELMKSTMMMSKLGNMESAQATEYLTSTLNGFNLEAKDSISIIDKLIALDNNYATSVAEIATALQRSSAAGKLAGVTFDELVSYITVVSSVTRKSADSIGESFKTIFARMESVKAGSQFDDMGESVNNVEKVLRNLGIVLRDTPTSFRPVGDVLDEIAKKWSGLDTVVRNQIAGAIGGIRQYTNIITLMDNYSMVLEAQTIAADSAGLAQKRYAIYLDSVEAATNRLTSAWNKLATSAGTSADIKGFINLGTALLGVIEKIGLLETIVVAFATFLSTKVGFIIPFISNAFASLAMNIGLSATAAGSLSMALSGTLVGVVLVLASAIGVGLVNAFKAMNVSMVDTYNNFTKLKSASDATQQELKDIATSYEELANKQNKSSDDIIKLLDIQDVLNTKYGALTDGIDIYSAAISGNSELIQENIRYIKELAVAEANEFLAANQGELDKSKTYLETKRPFGTMQQQFGGGLPIVEKTVIEHLADLAKEVTKAQVAGNKEWAASAKEAYDQLLLEVTAAQSLVAEAKHYQNVIDVMSGKKGLINIENLSDAEKQSNALSSALNTLNSELDAVNTAMKEQNETGAISSSTALDMKMNYADLAPYITQVGDAYYFDTMAAREFIFSQINSTLATLGAKDALFMAANGNYVLANSALIAANATNQEIASLNALVGRANALGSLAGVSAPSGGGGGSVESAEKKMLDAQVKSLEGKKKALQDVLDEFNKYIEAQKLSLKLTKEEKDFNDELAKKNKSLAKLKTEITILGLDDSEEARAQRLLMEEDAATLEEEITKDKEDRKYNLQIEALDKVQKEFEDNIDRQMGLLDDQISKYREMESQIKSTGGGVGGLTKATQSLAQFTVEAGIKIAEVYSKQYELSQKNIQSLQGQINKWREMGWTVDDVNIRAQNAAASLAWGMSFNLGQEPKGAKPLTAWEKMMANDPLNIFNKHNGGLIEEHHDGDFAGSLKTNEVFAKLLKGEYVATEGQMKNFMENVLPSIASAPSVYSSNKSGDTSINMDVNVAGNLDKTVLPELKASVLDAVNKAMINRGIKRNAGNLSI